MAERQQRRSVALGVPALIVAVLAIAALWRLGGPAEGERGAAATIGINEDRRVSLERVRVRQLTSERTFWVGEIEDEPTFVVAERPIAIEPGAFVSIVGTVEPAPEPAGARRAWNVDDATARAVHDRGVYIRASDIRPATQP